MLRRSAAVTCVARGVSPSPSAATLARSSWSSSIGTPTSFQHPILFHSKRSFFDHKTQPPPFQDENSKEGNKRVSEKAGILGAQPNAPGSAYGTQQTRGSIEPPLPNPPRGAHPHHPDFLPAAQEKKAHAAKLNESTPDEDSSNFLKLIQREIEDEQYRLDKDEPPAAGGGAAQGWGDVMHAEGSSVWSIERIWRPKPLESLRGNDHGDNQQRNTSASAAPSAQATASEGEVPVEEVASSTSAPSSSSVEIPSWLRALRKFQDGVEERHVVRVQLTARDPSKDPEVDIRGEQNPFTLTIYKRLQTNRFNNDDGKNNGDEFGSPTAGSLIADNQEASSWYRFPVVHLHCDVVEGELVVDKIRIVAPEEAVQMDYPSPSSSSAGARSTSAVTETGLVPSLGLTEDPSAVAAYLWNSQYYPGPNLNECEEGFLDALQVWMSERCFDDTFAETLGLRSVWVEQLEYERWLKQLKSFVAA